MRWMTGFLAVAALATLAEAQTSPDAFEVCAQKADPTARLACFDQEMQRRHATKAPAAASGAPAAAVAPHAAATPAAPAAAVPAAGAAAATAASHAEENVGLQGAALRKRQREQGIVEEHPKPIVAQVTRSESHPDHRYTFVLDNGQVWEQAESRPGLFIDTHETVTITPGVLGAFFMETSRHQSFRVRRLN